MDVIIENPYKEPIKISSNGVVTGKRGRSKVIHFTTNFEGYQALVTNEKDHRVLNPDHKKSYTLIAIYDSFMEPIAGIEEMDSKYMNQYKFLIEMI